MKKKIMSLFVAVAIASCSTGCPTYPVISKADFKSQTDEVLRDRLLKLTPLGASEAEVIEAIKSKLRRDPEIIQIIQSPNSRPRFSRGLPDVDDKLIRSHLAWHDWAHGCFLTGGVVTGYWWIDKSDRLIDLKVEHWSDGL